MLNSNGPGFLFHAATAEGEGGIGVVELYGGGAAPVLSRLFVPRGGRMPQEGEIRLGTFIEPSGEAIDEVLLAPLAPRASWCGLAGWNLSCHGGSLVQRRLRAALISAGGLERDREGIVAAATALGALGPLEGEALNLLPSARTERAARYLLAAASGSLTRRIEGALGTLRAGDTPGARAEIDAMLQAAPAVLRLLSPRRVLIAGRPNAGKSSLFNRLAEKERAAVTPIAGTTRDLLEETVEIAGYPVVFIDSSGLRPEEEAADPVEREGMRRALGAASDALLFLIDRAGPPLPDEADFMARLPPERVLLVRTKADLLGSRGSAVEGHGSWISAKTGEGLDGLRKTILKEWLGPPEEEDLPPAPFAPRLVERVRRCAAASSVDDLLAALVQCLPCDERGEGLKERVDPR